MYVGCLMGPTEGRPATFNVPWLRMLFWYVTVDIQRKCEVPIVAEDGSTYEKTLEWTGNPWIRDGIFRICFQNIFANDFLSKVLLQPHSTTTGSRRGMHHNWPFQRIPLSAWVERCILRTSSRLEKVLRTQKTKSPFHPCVFSMYEVNKNTFCLNIEYMYICRNEFVLQP